MWFFETKLGRESSMLVSVKTIERGTKRQKWYLEAKVALILYSIETDMELGSRMERSKRISHQQKNQEK